MWPLPVVPSLLQQTDAALLLRTRIRTPCCLSRLWRWRRSCLPRARVRSPESRGNVSLSGRDDAHAVTATGGKKGTGLTPDLSSMILMPDKEMLTQILCLCLPWDRAATAIPWWKKNKTQPLYFSTEHKLNQKFILREALMSSAVANGCFFTMLGSRWCCMCVNETYHWAEI